MLMNVFVDAVIFTPLPAYHILFSVRRGFYFCDPQTRQCPCRGHPNILFKTRFFMGVKEFNIPHANMLFLGPFFDYRLSIDLHNIVFSFNKNKWDMLPYLGYGGFFFNWERHPVSYLDGG